MFKVPNLYRLKTGELKTTDKDGNNGVFLIPHSRKMFRVIASDGGGWEHVSVTSSAHKTPPWRDMCFIKDQFWGEEDAVIQIHPPVSEYVNNHPLCLHLWRKSGTNDYCQWPPKIMV